MQLAATPDPLGEATKLVQRLTQHAGVKLQSHLLAFEVYSRKGRLLLALRAAKQALRLAGPSDPQAHGVLVRVAQLAATAPAEEAPAAAGAAGAAGGAANGTAAGAVVASEVVEQQVAELLGGAPSAAAYHEQWVAQHGSSSLQNRTAAAELTAALHPDQAAAAAEQLVAGGMAGASHKEAVAVYELLRDRLRQPAAAEAWKHAAASVFRLSAFFDGPDRVEVPLPDKATAEANGVAHGVEKLAVK